MSRYFGEQVNIYMGIFANFQLFHPVTRENMTSLSS